jgi:hypothetical protein
MDIDLSSVPFSLPLDYYHSSERFARAKGTEEERKHEKGE